MNIVINNNDNNLIPINNVLEIYKSLCPNYSNGNCMQQVGYENYEQIGICGDTTKCNSIKTFTEKINKYGKGR